MVVVAAVINTVMFVVVLTVVDLSLFALDCSSISFLMVIIEEVMGSLVISVFFITIGVWEIGAVVNA